MVIHNKVQVRFFASLRQVAGSKSIEFDFADPVSVRKLIREILEEIPGLEVDIIDDQGELHAHINVLVNGRDVRYLDGKLDSLLADGDQVSIFPALGGG
jgi:molybdopterin synthase sulfur carrier subunit